MRKLLGIVVGAASLSLAAADQARAAVPFYIFFTDYCDCLTVYKEPLDNHKWFVGSWDWECTGGASSTLIHGVVASGESILGTQPVDSTGVPAGFSATLLLDRAIPGAGHGHVTATFDGVTNVSIADEADYFFRTNPAGCGTNGMPRLFP